MKFPKQTIKFHLLMLLASGFAGSLLSLFFFFTLSGRIQIEDDKNKVIQRNITEIQNISYNLRLIDTPNPQFDEIDYSVRIIDLSTICIVEGGIPPDFIKVSNLPKADNSMIAELENIQKNWEKFKEKKSTIVGEPLYNNIKTPFDTIINGNRIEHFKTTVVYNPKIAEAQSEIQKLIIEYRTENEKLSQLIETKKSKLILYQSLSILLIILLIGFVSFRIYKIVKNRVLKNIKTVETATHKIINGEVENMDLAYSQEDELKQLYETANQLKFKILDITQYVQNLENDNFLTRLDQYNKTNKLDIALVALRRNLNKKKIEEQTRISEEKIRQWSLEGQTKFNEILRSHASDFNELADDIIKNLVLFLNAAQGGLFIYNDNDLQEPFLELKSAFAYDRKKFLTKRIALGEGLIGMCAVERNLVYLTNIPPDYMEIESGLGDAIPKSLLIFPLKTETELMGVIEIASFFEIKQYEVEFIENIGQNITSTLANSRIGTRTSELLKESQKKSEELAMRDAEMQKSIREMRSTQEEAQQKEAEMSSILSAVDQTLLKAEFLTDGSIITMNRLYLSKMEYHFEELKHKKVFDFIRAEEVDSFREIWQKLIADQTSGLEHRQLSKNKNILWFLSQYSPIKNESGNVVRILYLGNDVTHQKELEERNQNLLNETLGKTILISTHENTIKQQSAELHHKQEQVQNQDVEISSLQTAIDNSLLKAEYSTRGSIINANIKFLSTYKIGFDSLNTQNVRDLIPKDHLPAFEQQWSNLHLGIPFHGISQRMTENAQEQWFSEAYTPIEDKDGIIFKIIYLAIDITELITNKKSGDISREELNKTNQELVNNFNEISKQTNLLKKEIQAKKDYNAALMKRFESPADKKYYTWLQNLKIS